jgi:acetylglutamate kinase
MKHLNIVKIGGNVIDNPDKLALFLKNFAALKHPKILVHGGGKSATTLAQKLNLPQIMLEGKRVTDFDTLQLTIMVYAGLINKTIVSKLQAENCNALGLSGADGNIIRSKKRSAAPIDFGFVGDVLEDGIDTKQLIAYLNQDITLVMCPITHDGLGNLLNTNADTLAAKIAAALGHAYETSLTYCFEKDGVLENPDNANSIIHKLNKSQYVTHKNLGNISDGMIPKLDNAFEALATGVQHVKICNASSLTATGFETTGTQLLDE